MTASTLRPAEFVLPGHPDKLADAVADAIVVEARRREARALVGVEVAVHRDVVFIDGRVACEGAEEIDLRALTRAVYQSAGYGADFGPHPRRLELRTDLVLGPLIPGEAEFREVADDQAIVTGYACSTPGTAFLPVEHAVARELAHGLFRLARTRPELRLGPDGKLLVFVAESPGRRTFRLESISVSIQHAANWDPVAARRAIEAMLRAGSEGFAARVPGFELVDNAELVINACGDFVVGGPQGDNGLSGKKLVVDFYGPRVPIGGGALSGKDCYKVDRAGAIIARQLAIAAVERLGCLECLVTLGIRPGDREFRVLRAEAETRQPIALSGLAGLIDLRLASVANSTTGQDLIDLARWGSFAPVPEYGEQRAPATP
jgi:S-adenosylmethionine synthetase